MSDFAADEHQADPSYLAHKQIMLGLGSIYTIRATLANVFYDLCEHPELIPELREEVEQVMFQGGGWDKPTLVTCFSEITFPTQLTEGIMLTASFLTCRIAKMWKLDSFIMEVQRVNPLSLSESHIRHWTLD